MAQMVAAGHLTYVEAREIVSEYDRGHLRALEVVSILTILASLFGVKPITGLTTTAPLAAASRGWQAAEIALHRFLGVSQLRALTKAESNAARRILRRQFEDDTQRIARGVSSGAMDPQVWQESMARNIVEYATQAAVAGAGVVPGAAVQATVNAKIEAQSAYLLRFTVQIVGRKLVGRPMSLVSITARASQYGGVGWGSYFMGQGNDPLFGYVDRWLTRDDRMVCRLCRPRHGRYYLPQQGPFPGWDCLGLCRCQRKPEYNLEAYLDLVGGAAVPAVPRGVPIAPQSTPSLRAGTGAGTAFGRAIIAPAASTLAHPEGSRAAASGAAANGSTAGSRTQRVPRQRVPEAAAAKRTATP